MIRSRPKVGIELTLVVQKAMPRKPSADAISAHRPAIPK
jgi:hypothetical protein